MSRIVTIDCTPSEIRIAVGTKGLAGVALEHVVCCPLELAANEELISSPKTLEAIQSLLKKVGVRSGDAIVCVGRSSIELRALTLPTVDRNELPDMVRFAAQRHFANVGDAWPIDYVTMPSSQENMTECLAASMNPVLIERVHKVLETCGLTLTQLVLRPMASATMAVVKQPQLASSVVLLLDLFRDEADMAVVENGHVVFMRNVRFSGSNDVANQQVLTGEIKRTMIAAASQRPNLNVEQIRIWGDDSQHAELCRALSQALSVPVTSLDPFPLFDATPSVRSEAGGDAGKFAATLGALIAPQVADRLIDFSNPRKRIEKSKPIVMYATAGALAAILLLGGLAGYWMSHSALDKEIATLNSVIKGNEETIKLTTKKVDDWNKVEKFLKGDRNWLDELEYLSARAASSDKAIFTLTTFTTDVPTGSSTIATKFVATERDDVPEILSAFSDPQHIVKNKGVIPNQDRTNQQFPWVADLQMKMPAINVIDPRNVATKKPTEQKPPEKKPLEKKPAEITPAEKPPAEQPINVDAPTKPDSTQPITPVEAAPVKELPPKPAEPTVKEPTVKEPAEKEPVKEPEPEPSNKIVNTIGAGA